MPRRSVHIVRYSARRVNEVRNLATAVMPGHQPCRVVVRLNEKVDTEFAQFGQRPIGLHWVLNNVAVECNRTSRSVGASDGINHAHGVGRCVGFSAPAVFV
jgi:hypothetical protein